MDMDVKFLLLFAIVFFVAASRGEKLHHKCIHNEIAKKYPKTFISHLGSDGGADFRNRRQTGDYLPYRIAVYFVTENITNSSTFLPLLNDPSGGFQLAINYLQSVLSVVRASHNLTITPRCFDRNDDGDCIRVEDPSTCGPHTVVPNEHLGTTMVCDPTCREVGGSSIGVDADYILYVTSVDDENCDGGTLAYASLCFADDVNFRSLAGFTNICPLGLEYGNHAFFMLMLHEILHAIGFSSINFEFFVDENGDRYSALTSFTINGEQVLAINSSKVLSYGRDYYSCPNLPGVLLENEGGDGSASSHWEIRTLSYEVMVASSAEFESDYTSISNFTLNLLEDSGWYKVDYAVAESLYNYELLWGKGEGCKFITADCNDWSYSCSPPGVDGCSYDYQAVATCTTFDFYDGCYYFNPYSNGFCNSPGAPITRSCFPLIYNDDTHDGRCYNHQCYRYTDTQQLLYTVTRLGSTVICPHDGARLRFSDGAVLTCPPADLTCSRNTSITLLDPGTVPTILCHSSCATCSRASNQAYCLTCNGLLTLRGAAPSVCTSDTCGHGTFLNSSSMECTACAVGCRACTGPYNSDCLACEDETLYRVTTDEPATSSACLPEDECDDVTITTSGDRICSLNGASSNNSHKYLLLLLLVVYSLFM